MTAFTSDVNNKTVLITGAARRIGRALAEDLAAAGWAVAVIYNASSKDADDVVAAIKARGGKAASVGGDLADPKAVADVVPKAARAFPPARCKVFQSAPDP